jgi:putative transposase
MTFATAVAEAEALLPGVPVPSGEDPRWQAIIAVAEFIPTDPLAVWQFAEKWGSVPEPDLQSAVAACLVEHLLEQHLALIAPLALAAARGNATLASTIKRAWVAPELAVSGMRGKSTHIERGDQKKAMRPSRRKEVSRWIHAQFGMSCVRACRLGGISRVSGYRRSVTRDQSTLRLRIREVAMSRPRFGFERIHLMLRREGWRVNLKRVHRLYRLEGLQVRMRVRRRKRLSLHRGPVLRPTSLGERWSMDFVHDQLADGRAFRVLTMVDNWSRESVLLEAGFRLTGDDVVKALTKVATLRPLRRSITVDHGTEFTSKALDQWAWENGVQLNFTRPGKPHG